MIHNQAHTAKPHPSATAGLPPADQFTVFVAPGIDTVNGPVIVQDLATNESLHIIVAEATEQDFVTARLAENGNDTEVIYRSEVVAVLQDITRLWPNQVIFAPLSLAPTPHCAGDTIEAEANHHAWDGTDPASLRRKPVLVPDYIPGLDTLEVTLGFGPQKPKLKIEPAGAGDTFVRVNGKALFRLQGVDPHEITRDDIRITRV